MHVPAQGQIGEEAARGSSKVKVAKFSSFLACAQSFAKSKHGAAVRGKKDPLEFGQALVLSGFNSGDDKTGGRTGFADFLAKIIRAVRERMECP